VKIADIMTTELVTAAPDAGYKDVVELLVRAGVSGLPVIAPDGRLVGLITEADLISKEAYNGRRHRALALLADVVSGRDHRWATKATGSLAADVMTRDVMVCRPGDDARVVARRMLERGVKRMPVVAGGKLVGLVSRRDILKMFDRPDPAIAQDVDRLLSDSLRMPADHHVHASVRDGVVTLTGDVRYEWDKRMVVSMARDVAGVIGVVSDLRHREPNPVPSWGPSVFRT
jgi:CBS domain-containing protein